MPTGSTIHTILQCFVDINLETNENAIYSLDLLDVNLAQPTYNVDEGQYVDIIVSLSAPSVNGYEEVEVGIVANNTSFSDFDMLGETYPRTLVFSAGQQSHTIRFLANSDLFEEGIESFDVILGFFANVNPGPIITSTVNIIDLTNLKEVFISQQGSYVSGTDFTFSTIENSSKDIIISLDSPSVYGVESVTVQITNGTASLNDYIIVGNTNLTWAIGEQDKTITITAKNDTLIESSETLNIKLVNPVNTNIISPSEAIFYIIDNSPQSLFAQINIQGIYTQIGGTSLQNVTQLRTIGSGQQRKFPSNYKQYSIKFWNRFNNSDCR